ncbi:MAG: sugar transferase, partial [Nocardioides sp.]|nr:sugar transferase [Nocardioides sp.]
MNAIADPQIVLPLPGSGPTGLVEAPGPDASDVLVGAHPDALARPRAHRGLLAVADVACAVVGAVSAAAWGVSVALLVGVPLLWVCLIALNRGYESRLVPVGSQDLSRVTRTGLQLAVIGAALVWTLDWSTERAELVTLVAVTTGLSLGHRILGTATTHWLRSRGATAARRVVIAGHPNQAEPVITELSRTSATIFEVAGVCLPHRSHDRKAHSVDHRDDHWAEQGDNELDELLALVRSEAADAVILLPCDHVTPQVLRRLTWELETADAQLFVAPGILDVAESRSTIAYAGGLPMVHIRPAELRGARQIFKAGVERTLALLAVVALAPVFLSLMAAIMIDSRGNPIYRQLRVGRGGREFTMFKLRTMTTDADRRVADLGKQNEAGGVLFKIRADPRITRLG